MNLRYIYKYQLYTIQYYNNALRGYRDVYSNFTRISKFSLLFVDLSLTLQLAIGKKLLTAAMFILTFSIFSFLPVDLEPSQ